MNDIACILYHTVLSDYINGNNWVVYTECLYYAAVRERFNGFHEGSHWSALSGLALGEATDRSGPAGHLGPLQIVTGMKDWDP